MLEPREGTPDLSAAFSFLSGVRLRLHELAGRDQNALSFDAQESLSEHPAALMRDYYRQARVVDQAVRQAIEASTEKAGTLLGRFHEWRSRLSTSEFTVSRDRVLLRGAQAAAGSEPVRVRGAPRAAAGAGHHRAVAGFRSASQMGRLEAAAVPAQGFRWACGPCRKSGVLPSALPEWRNIECLVVRDFYHRYTVDEHTLVAIGSLETVTDGRFTDLMSEIEDPWLVRFALLMHDIGKGSGRDHSMASVEIARAVMERLGAPETDRETIEFLVLRHLDLSSVMSSRDLYDGSTARALADRVGTLERLKLLTMLTYADISAVNPQAMTPWRWNSSGACT